MCVDYFKEGDQSSVLFSPVDSIIVFALVWYLIDPDSMVQERNVEYDFEGNIV